MNIPLEPMTDSQSLYAIREALVYLNEEIFLMFVYFAFFLPALRLVNKKLQPKGD